MMLPADQAERDLWREYEARTPLSKQHHETLSQYLPGGETRSSTYFPPYPLTLQQGEGSRVWDRDGHEYLDVLNNYTALVHGHAHPTILNEVEKVMRNGTAFPASHPSQLELARLLCERLPAVEQIRFTNSGTESALLASRIVRAATRRQRLVLIEGGFHGSVPEFLDGGPDVIRIPYNDLDAAAMVLDASIAAVFVEAFVGASVTPAVPSYLVALADLAHKAGALVVLDEVQGLRNAYRGMHAEHGVTPDLLLLGKIIGGGFPVGAVGGRASLMRMASAAYPGSLSHPGTYNGNVMSMTAGRVAMELLDDEAITELNTWASTLQLQLEMAAQAAGLSARVTMAGSILHVRLDSSLGLDLAAPLHLSLLLEGIFSAPRGMLNLSTAMDALQIKKILSSYERAFERVTKVAGAVD